MWLWRLTSPKICGQQDLKKSQYLNLGPGAGRDQCPQVAEVFLICGKVNLLVLFRPNVKEGFRIREGDLLNLVYQFK